MGGQGRGEMAERCRSTEKFSLGQLVGDPSANARFRKGVAEESWLVREVASGGCGG